jgi:hypothetical protein
MTPASNVTNANIEMNIFDSVRLSRQKNNAKKKWDAKLSTP